MFTRRLNSNSISLSNPNKSWKQIHDQKNRKWLNITYIWKIGDSEDEAYRVENVGFTATVQTSDGIEFLVKSIDLDSLAVGLEALDHHWLYIHVCDVSSDVQSSKAATDSKDFVKHNFAAKTRTASRSENENTRHLHRFYNLPAIISTAAHPAHVHWWWRKSNL